MDGSGLHPRLVAMLRSHGWAGLTQAQETAVGPLLTGGHALLVAPTGHGKTEAALLPVMSRLLEARDDMEAREVPWPKGFKAIYVTPLRALNRDLMGRLESWADALDLRIGVRHGDTKQSERSKQSRNPPDLLITTPETVQLLLYGDTLRRHLRTVRFVVLDEIHDLCISERGAQLSVALERMEEVIGQPETLAWQPAKERTCPEQPSGQSGFQRIGLSATIADADLVAGWMVGPGRKATVLRVNATKEIRLAVDFPTDGPGTKAAASEMGVPPAVAAELQLVQTIAAEHERCLVFQNTRQGAELLASRSHLGGIGLGLHHGSLSADMRADVEDQFKRGDLRALVATSSLELGIDVGAIDHVVQMHSPRSVARMVQRLGRAGHRVGAVSQGTLIGAGSEDVLECIAVAGMASAGHLEPLAPRTSPLVVLANQLVALTNEYAHLQKGWCRAVVGRAGAFADLDDGLFEATWEALLDVQTLHAEDAGTMQRSGRARRHFLDHIGLIPDERTYRVIDEATKRTVGTVDDAFVAASLHPGASFVMGGRGWNVLEVEAEAERVRVAPAKDLGPVPDWTGSMLPVSFDVAQATARVRGQLADGSFDVTPVVVHQAALAAAMEPITAQLDAGQRIPSDRCVTIESSGREVVANVALGTRGNEALGRITQALLAQRIGKTVGMQSDAYRLRFQFPDRHDVDDLEALWSSLEPDSLDLLVAMLLRDSPTLKHHLVHVAKHFGALPKDLDPNRFGRTKLDALMGHVALQEESMARLVHDRLDLDAVAGFVRGLHDGTLEVVRQPMGPISRLGQTDAQRMLVSTNDEALLAKVRERIEDSDVLMVCTQCRNTSQSQVHLLAPRIHCRRCQSNQVACLRPWHKDGLHVLGKGTLTAEERKERARIQRNAALVASFGPAAVCALVGRGVGPTAAARILQKMPDTKQPLFWRLVLEEELQFARTNAYWGK